MKHSPSGRSAPLLFSTLALAALAAPGSSAASNQAMGGDSPGEQKDIEVVRVVGEKVERSLKETTSSVAVISEDTLNALRSYTVSSLLSEIPNVIVTTGSAPNIRGVTGNGSAGGFNSITGGAKPRVSTLIDGVAEPFVADLTGDSGIWDIEQIEVFRGPQSTSNGRNSIGGMVYIQTKDPTFEWEGAGRVGYRDQDEYLDGAVMLSGPLVDDILAFRVAAQALNADTITDDRGFDSNPPDYDLDEIETRRLKTKLLWTPTTDLRVLLTYSGNNEQGDTGRVLYSAKDPWAYERIFFRDIETDSDTTSARIDYSFSERFSLEVLAAYTDYQWGFDSYEADPALEQQLVFDQQDITLDARLHAGQAGDSVYGFLGLAYFEREQDFESTGAYLYIGDDSSDAAALYGEVTWAINDRLRLTGGLRVEREQQQRYFNYISFERASDLDTDETITLPKIELQYDLDLHTTVGLSARKGYNAPGGAFAFASGNYYYFDEESVYTYEASLRGGWFDNRLNLAGNLFYNDYDGYQALNSLREISNMDAVETYGLELQAEALLTPDLALSLGLGLLETEIKDGGAAYPAVNGNELSNAPAITGSLDLYYTFSSAFGAGAQVRYVDEYYGDLENSDERVAGDYYLARAYADITLDHWSISAYVNNLTDEEAFTVREPPGRSAADGYVAFVDPRTVGVTVTYHFF
ncbi:TonB-dependent receptor [Mangrovimicrobium sediminis]|uniref:TonB-dependent receptor n=1 Tax=Mangrovimicrobium sediminis TaxID=2562682 RepID=UPI0014368ABD|nr:TonB-dependent receptor [Haliea sp. SAOS-164]